jgi:alkylation response protein AidB-like acyl-CoA dehydrogenase
LSANNSQHILVFARTDKGLSCFFVEKSSGIEVLNNKKHQQFEEDFLTYSNLRFDNVKIPAENLIGDEGMGLEIAFDMINISRIHLGNVCNVLLRKILDELMKTAINKSDTSSYNKYKDYIIKTSISVNVYGLYAKYCFCYY